MAKKMGAIAAEMTDLMIPKNRKLKKKFFKPELLTTNYVRVKYLIGK